MIDEFVIVRVARPDERDARAGEHFLDLLAIRSKVIRIGMHEYDGPSDIRFGLLQFLDEPPLLLSINAKIRSLSDTPIPPGPSG
jgi:hypothetical protein